MKLKAPHIRAISALWVVAGCAVAMNDPRAQPAVDTTPNVATRVTAADVVGPDGVVYPDWRYAGVPGGIPEVEVRALASDFGALPDDGRDDSHALEVGAKAVAAMGGGALLLTKGAYHLDRPVVITDDHVVIRGQGADVTTLVFGYLSPPGGLGFFRPAEPDAVVGPDSWIEVHAAPRGGIHSFSLHVDHREVYTVPTGLLADENFVLRTRGDVVTRAATAGRHSLVARVEWNDGQRKETSLSVVVDPAFRLGPGRARYPIHPKSSVAGLLFVGDRTSGATWRLAADGRRGDRWLVLQSRPKLKAGDAVVLSAPSTPRWNAVIGNSCLWGEFRRYEFRVESVDGRRIELNQPLRIDFPKVDGPTVTQVFPIRRCGVEDITLVQTRKLWSSGVLFLNAWECWARGVRIVKAGRHPVYARYAKWCEIRDSELEDAWYHGGGGTAYAGWERSYDCLMENVTTRRLRHAPCLQWSAAGNVIRNSTFHGSDMQWHAGWTNENLFENCTVDADGTLGSYGFGGWASPPGDTAHGPQGPRNVVYNCDVRSPKAGLWFGGSNSGWLILYSRFQVGWGPGIYATRGSRDHTVRGNTFVLGDPGHPLLLLATADCTGFDVRDNRIIGGNGKIVAGAGIPATGEGNVFLPPGSTVPPRQDLAVPSIFLWQRGQR